jgi:hypothetical protein
MVGRRLVGGFGSQALVDEAPEIYGLAMKCCGESSWHWSVAYKADLDP